MIGSLEDHLAEDLFNDKVSKETRTFPNELRRAARRKLPYLHDAAELKNLRVLPGNRLEALKGEFAGFHSIRIKDQWRLVFMWKSSTPEKVQILEHHR